MSGLPALFWTFFRVGLLGFGGGYAMLPFIFQNVRQLGIMSEEEFSNLVALSQAMPGPIAVNAATYVGFYEAGLPGVAAAVLGLAMPSFCLVILAARLLNKFKESKGLQAVFLGIRPAVVGLVASAAALLARIALVGDLPALPAASPEAFAAYAAGLAGAVHVLPCLLFLATIFLVGKCKVSPIKVILLMGAVGALLA